MGYRSPRNDATFRDRLVRSGGLLSRKPQTPVYDPALDFVRRLLRDRRLSFYVLGGVTALCLSETSFFGVSNRERDHHPYRLRWAPDFASRPTVREEVRGAGF